jgi:hypothetical protein
LHREFGAFDRLFRRQRGRRLVFGLLLAGLGTHVLVSWRVRARRLPRSDVRQHRPGKNETEPEPLPWPVRDEPPKNPNHGLAEIWSMAAVA